MFKEKFYKAVLNICMFFYLAFIDEYLAFKGFFRLVFVFRGGKDHDARFKRFRCDSLRC